MQVDIRLTDLPRGEQELAAKRQRLVELQQQDRRAHNEMYQLEGELGSTVCMSCGYAHCQPCSTEALLERRA
jgi:hypothetical protein